ncbi:PAS domain-containing methyl-accepting chemotaxis protein, partial [Aduncisulcus paluster]
REVWILASYNPILDDQGKPIKVVKFATDITEQRLKAADFAGQISAIGKSEAVIEFNMDGTSLRDGCYQAGEYLRLGKGGREVWIQASYNPILDLNGKAFKVVKYASDVTAQVIARRKSEHVRGMMESVAAGAEELNASVQEISSAMSKSRETTMTAVGHVEGADKQAQRLTEAAQS